MCRATSDLPADNVRPKLELGAIDILLESSYIYKEYFATNYHFSEMRNPASSELCRTVRYERRG